MTDRLLQVTRTKSINGGTEPANGVNEDSWRMKFPRYRDIRSRLKVDLPRLTGDRRPLTFLLQREDLPVDKTEIPLQSSAGIKQ